MPSPPSLARRILVTDDAAAIRELVSTRLILAGHTVFTARNGREAMARMHERRYDALVLDLNMPELDGYGVLEQMKVFGCARPATLVLTARHNSEDVKTAIRLGARDYLAKPFDDRQLLMRVARLFRVVEVAAPDSSLEDMLDQAMNDAARMVG
jgi:DNA-binding response OmpR family regulator